MFTCFERPATYRVFVPWIFLLSVYLSTPLPLVCVRRARGRNSVACVSSAAVWPLVGGGLLVVACRDPELKSEIGLLRIPPRRRLRAACRVGRLVL